MKTNGKCGINALSVMDISNALLTSNHSALSHRDHEDKEEYQNQVEEDGGLVAGDLGHAFQLFKFCRY